jgi:uncharacterized protein (DUF4415 family)
MNENTQDTDDDAPFDWSRAQPASQVPHLARRRAARQNKQRVNMLIDPDIIEAFRARAAVQGVGYQTAINAALREWIKSEPLTTDTLRRVLREELHTE